MRVRVVLPHHLRILAGVSGEVSVEVKEPGTLQGMLEALEADFPALRGTIREYGSGERRAFLRFFAGEEDISHAGMQFELPEAVLRGQEALLVIGAVAGGCC